MYRYLNLLLLLMMITSCSPGPPMTPLPSPSPILNQPTISPSVSPEFTLRNYPRVDGSTSTLPLETTIACHLLEVPCTWQDGGPFMPTRRFGPDLLYADSSGAAEKIHTMWHSGTHQSYMNLIHGDADVILVAREPSDDELEAASQAGVVFEIQPIALDAFVFLAHAENPLESIKLSQIREVYSGGITNWEELGSNSGAIHTYQRNPNSGSQELMEKLVMKGTPMLNSPEMILETMMGPINAISDDPLGIGYSVFYYAQNIFPHDQIKLVGVDGITPSTATIADQSYPFTTQVYAVIREGTPPEHASAVFFNWLSSEAGQQVISESGYVPILS